LATVDALLTQVSLKRDPDVEIFALAYLDGALVGCMGLAQNVIKCTAVDDEIRGHNVVGSLLLEIRYQGLGRGHAQLCCYTKPIYAEQFGSLGFRKLAEVPGLAVLMEDDPRGIERYTAALSASFRAGDVIGGIVLNANPFTLGHEFLIRTAAAFCDVVHVFVVGEDASQFSYAERFALVSAGVAAMPEHGKIVVHHGSRYIVSRSTFPQYFLKDEADISRAYTGIDLQLFRQHIAPALGIRHRFVGSEPASAITAEYNAGMTYWLAEAPMNAPTIAVHLVDRIGAGGEAFVSASTVRRLLAAGEMEALKQLVPPTTYDYLERLAETRPPESDGRTDPA
jgi:[citrate (pro-3S)-lyase] ligase